MAIVATIRSGPELRPKVKACKINIANQQLVVNKKPRKEKYSGSYLTVDQMETYCFIKKEQIKASPIWLGKTLKIGQRRTGISKIKEKVVLGLIFLNTATVRRSF